MHLLRQNLFYVILVAAVVVLGGVILAAAASKGGEVEEELDKSEKLGRQLTGLGRPPLVSEADLQAERARVTASQREAVEVARLAQRLNSEDYEVIQLDVPGRGLTPAFPIDRDLYQRHLLRGQFDESYVQAMRAMLNDSRLASPPSAEAVERATQEWQARLAEQQRLEGGEMDDTGVAELSPLTGGTGWDAPEADTRTRLSPEIMKQAAEQAYKEQVLEAARSGWMYGGWESVDLKTALDAAERDTNPTDRQLWFRQLNLWLTRDILAAINQTNYQVLKDLPAGQQNVLRSPIKRLVSIELPDQYYCGRPVIGTAVARSGRSEREDRFTGPGGPGFEPDRPAPEVRAAGGQAVKAQTLTERQCDQQADVLHYRLKLIMPQQYLDEFAENLLQRNFHTILSVEMREVVPADAQIDSRNPAAGASQMYYYGPDAVMEVTLIGELQLLTSWERGTFDPQTREWTLPPLMPASVLGELPVAAQRDEDKQRLQNAGGRQQ
jgi:hypothetical protein